MNELIQKFMDKVLSEMERTFEKDGKIPGMLVMMTNTRGLVEIPYKREDDSTPLGIQQKVILTVLQATRSLGELAGVMMLHEAWCSRLPEGKESLKDVIRPALDPDRKEMIVCLYYDGDGNKGSVMYDIVRGKGKAKLENKNVQSGDELKSWLDDAFVSR